MLHKVLLTEAEYQYLLERKYNTPEEAAAGKRERRLLQRQARKAGMSAKAFRMKGDGQVLDDGSTSNGYSNDIADDRLLDDDENADDAIEATDEDKFFEIRDEVRGQINELMGDDELDEDALAEVIGDTIEQLEDLSLRGEAAKSAEAFVNYLHNMQKKYLH